MGVSGKEVATRFVDEFLGEGRLEVIDEVAAPGYIDHNLPSGLTPRMSISAFRGAFPDARFTVEDVIEERDRVVVRYSITGTNTGEFFGSPATGRRVDIDGISIYRLEGGRLAEAWVQYDQLGLMRQLGLVR